MLFRLDFKEELVYPNLRLPTLAPTTEQHFFQVWNPGHLANSQGAPALPQFMPASSGTPLQSTQTSLKDPFFVTTSSGTSPQGNLSQVLTPISNELKSIDERHALHCIYLGNGQLQDGEFKRAISNWKDGLTFQNSKKGNKSNPPYFDS